MIATSMVERAVATSRNFEPVDEIRLTQAIAGLQKKRSMLLGVEGEASEAMKKQIALLGLDLARVQSFKNHGFPMLSEEVLDWRLGHRDGIMLPTFALTAINSPEMKFKTEGRFSSFHNRRWEGSSTTMWPKLPDHLMRHYKDVWESMESRSNKKHENITLHTSYNGIIPDSVRSTIVDAPFTDVFLLREVKEDDWGIVTKKIQRPPKPVHLDPIVVGYDAGSLWIITTFDPTPLEDYVREEFAILAGSSLPALESRN